MAVTGLLDDVKLMILQIGLTDDFVDDVDLRLASLGYTVQDSDSWAVAFAINKVVNEIRNSCNITVIPEGLIPVAIDMVCGEFLLAKKGSGQLDGFAADLNSAALKQVREGDTDVAFAIESIKSPEQRLNAVIDYLINYGKAQFATYRRIKWT
jgi:hypothetical protein